MVATEQGDDDMRIAVFSDIHGNDVGFQAMLNDLAGRPTDAMVCLGDAIQGGPQPTQVVARLRDLGCPVVMGNADAYLLTGEETADEGQNDEQRRRMYEVRDWSFAQLSEADRAFIAAFQPTVELPLEGGHTLLAFHGSPASFDEVLLPSLPDANLYTVLAPYLPAIMTGGHTHWPHVRRMGTTESFFFNPGSVGFAFSHYQPDGIFRYEAWAEYAILSVEKGVVGLEFRRVPYDVNAIIDVYRAGGRPHSEFTIGQYGG